MLEEMVREEKVSRIGRGCSIGDDNIWLEGPSEEEGLFDKKIGAKLCCCIFLSFFFGYPPLLSKYYHVSLR
jgi:hypothetical protein